jgi:hypothetical protein
MQISREELYRRVWETPVTKLAKEFDIVGANRILATCAN